MYRHLTYTPAESVVIITSTHKDVTERLLELNPGLAAEVKEVLESNKAERHLRGGMATKEKYQHSREAGRCVREK
ncbi:MAG: sporulation transcriptional regulator SpoIIID [Anaerovoracaceae bacterium]|nr:sporulation transcriptional regulator SpoIIID [Anaerovoracaceae bacterium]